MSSALSTINSTGDTTTTQPNPSTPTPTAAISSTTITTTFITNNHAISIDPTDTDFTSSFPPHSEEAVHEMGQRMIALARERHIAAGFSESTAPTQVPQPCESPLWEAATLAYTDPDESNRRVQALVGQPYFIEDDEWVGLAVEWGCVAGIRILRDHGFRPSIKAAGTAITESCRRSLGTSAEAALEILRPLLEVTNSYGSEFARAVAERSGRSACQVARETCEVNDLPNDHELIRVITTWCKEQTGQDW